MDLLLIVLACICAAVAYTTFGYNLTNEVSLLFEEFNIPDWVYMVFWAFWAPIALLVFLFVISFIIIIPIFFICLMLFLSICILIDIIRNKFVKH